MRFIQQQIRQQLHLAKLDKNPHKEQLINRENLQSM